eukprot:TRINITY_DN65176_c0_g1_i2.p1 TRINITY_DN65176_c0_g1~~TRINITY_DN65176_c0_g1_i2.p1  ORF type:complete len:130 (+),score=15.12 TRINITY_DN65176_c0_g1_i2:124-513(+)
MAPPESSGVIRAPDRGSFPLDHFGECTEEQRKYMRCLSRNKFDNMSCRHLSQAYLQCRMDNGLMTKEDMSRLGFLPSETAEVSPRKRKERRKEEDGFVPALTLTLPIYRRLGLAYVFDQLSSFVETFTK